MLTPFLFIVMFFFIEGFDIYKHLHDTYIYDRTRTVRIWHLSEQRHSRVGVVLEHLSYFPQSQLWLIYASLFCLP